MISVELINKAFVILNMMNFILQMQNIFNKMGRYYSEHEEMLNLFLVLLQDMTIYNDFIKKVTNSCL
jgi:hypothetical protein